ncbi:MAG: Ammonia permease, partial [Pelotomaculum thermopropionicum]
DDSLDAFGVHGIGGTWGAVATGLFASTAVNPGGANGLFYGNPGQLTIQLAAVAVTWAIAIVGTLVILKVIGLFARLCASEEEQDTGLDITQHGEDAYTDFVVTAASFSIPESSAAKVSAGAVKTV